MSSEPDGDSACSHTMSSHDELLGYQRRAWNHQVRTGNPWTTPVDSEAVQRARAGDLQLVLTPSRIVPRDWYPPLSGAPVLCLASGGGQQAPLLAAAGAQVTVFDNSDQQLAQDRLVAEREGLQLQTVRGDMADLSCFADASFGLVFHPCSNCFAPEVRPVWRECARVLRPGGVLLAGFANPLRFIFEDSRLENGSLAVRYRVPTSDLKDLTPQERMDLLQHRWEPLMFGHTLEDQIGGQLDAGFLLAAMYEDRCAQHEGDALSDYIASFIATRAIRSSER